MSLIKFLKLSYKYYKGSADTKPDIKEIFSFIHELDKTRSKKIQMQWQQYPVAYKVYTGKSYLENLKDNNFEENTFGHDLQQWFEEDNYDLFKESLDTVIIKNKLDAKFWEHHTFQHDVIHFLNNYDTSPIGEVMVLSFNLAKEWRWSYFAILFSSLFIALRNTFTKGGWKKIKYIPILVYIRLVIEGYKKGKKAEWLMTIDFEELYGLPTADVKKLLNVKPSVYWEHIKPRWAKLHKHYKKFKENNGATNTKTAS